MAWPCHFRIPDKDDREHQAVKKFIEGKAEEATRNNRLWWGGEESCYKPIFINGRCPFLAGDKEPYACELIRRFEYCRRDLLEGIRCECPIEFCLNPT